jgi:hypothetical protein
MRTYSCPKFRENNIFQFLIFNFWIYWPLWACPEGRKKSLNASDIATLITNKSDSCPSVILISQRARWPLEGNKIFPWTSPSRVFEEARPLRVFKEARPDFGPFGTECGAIILLVDYRTNSLGQVPTLGPLARSAVVIIPLDKSRLWALWHGVRW